MTEMSKFIYLFEELIILFLCLEAPLSTLLTI